MAPTDNVGTLSSLAKATTFVFAFSFSLVNTIIFFANPNTTCVWSVVLFMASLAYLALESVGLHLKIRRLIILACVIWLINAVFSMWIFIAVAKQPFKR